MYYGVGNFSVTLLLLLRDKFRLTTLRHYRAEVSVLLQGVMVEHLGAANITRSNQRAYAVTPDEV